MLSMELDLIDSFELAEGPFCNTSLGETSTKAVQKKIGNNYPTIQNQFSLKGKHK